MFYSLHIIYLHVYVKKDESKKTWFATLTMKNHTYSYEYELWKRFRHVLPQQEKDMQENSSWCILCYYIR